MLDEIFNHKMDYSINFFLRDDICSISTYILIIIIVIFIYKNVKDTDNIIKISILIILIIYFILFIINLRMLTNTNLTKKYIKPEILSKNLNTGDIVYFRAYQINSIGLPILYILLCLQEYYFNHIGIIYKNPEGKILIIESTAKEHYCNLSNKKKNGFIMTNFIDRVKNAKMSRIHVYKNNLHEYINMEKFNESINKYKNYSYLENNVHCLNLITTIFQENGLMKKDNIIPYLLDDLIKPENYIVPIKIQKPILVKEFSNYI